MPPHPLAMGYQTLKLMREQKLRLNTHTLFLNL